LDQLIGGSVTNTAVAQADGISSNASSVTVTAVQIRALSLVKTATPTTFSAVDAPIAYGYVVTNTGNVPLDAPITVTDDKTAVTCPDGGLAPGASTICTATYTITQADMDAGSVTNTATARAGGPGGPASNPAQVTVTAAGTPPPVDQGETAGEVVSSSSIEIDKSPKLQNGKPGRTVKFTITVTNTGASTLTGIAVSDPLSPRCARTSATTPALASLAPGASVRYTCKRSDVRAAFTNVATVVGTGPLGVSVSGSSTARVLVYTRGKLSLRKRADRVRARPGDRIIFRIALRSHGRAPARGVRVCDRLPDPLRFVRAPGAMRRNGQICWAIPSLPAGRSRTLKIVARVPEVSAARTVRNLAGAIARNADPRKASANVRLLPARRSARFTG
jgi:uncharacterized repeat protein (TIGR01451 family)